MIVAVPNTYKLLVVNVLSTNRLLYNVKFEKLAFAGKNCAPIIPLDIFVAFRLSIADPLPIILLNLPVPFTSKLYKGTDVLIPTLFPTVKFP